MHRFNLLMNFDRQALEDFCLSRGIRKLSLFGSALRDDFRPGESDFDVLAEFKPSALKGIGLDFFSYGDELEKNFGRQGGLLLQAKSIHQTPCGERKCSYL